MTSLETFTITVVETVNILAFPSYTTNRSPFVFKLVSVGFLPLANKRELDHRYTINTVYYKHHNTQILLNLRCLQVRSPGVHKLWQMYLSLCLGTMKHNYHNGPDF